MEGTAQDLESMEEVYPLCNQGRRSDPHHPMRAGAINGFTNTVAVLPAIVVIAACNIDARKANKPQLPNIVFVLVDDLGWSDLGCYGNEKHESPNIDKLASDGMRFTDGYAASPVCGPTRSSILSGKYPSRTGYTHNWFTPNPEEQPFWGEGIPRTEHAFMKLEEFTLAEALKVAGYQTAFVGKWHLGEAPYSPRRQGFDVNVGGSHWGHPLEGYFSPYDMPNLENGSQGEYLTDRLTSEAIKVMEAFSKSEKPWFLYMNYYTVHAPIQSKSEKISKYRKKSSQANVENIGVEYAAMVESLDENVGRLTQWLDDKDLRKDTVILFTSDNGGWVGATTNHPLRSYKGHLLEGGIRVPWIVSWPGVTEPGSICRKPVISTDFYPTILDIIGVMSRPDQHRDGVSFAPMLKGDPHFDRGAMVWHYPHVRISKPGSAIRSADWKLIYYYEDGRRELYHLKDDIGESDDLSGRLPEKAAAMKEQLDAMLKEQGAKIPSSNPS